MKKVLACVALVATLAACSEEPAPAPQPTETVAPPPVEPTLPAPDDAAFSAAFAKACPDAETVSTALCKSAGMGQEGFLCDYGLGDDEYRRNSASLVPGDGEWVIADPDTTCAADDAA